MRSNTTKTGARRYLLAVPLIVFLLLSALFAHRLIKGGDPAIVPSALIDRAAPELTLAPLPGLTRDGKPTSGLTSAMLRQGKVTIVNFWASWCGPCRVEHPILMQLAAVDGLQVTGVNYKDVAENARRFLGQLGDPFEAVGVDADGSTAVNWGVYGVPETFIVDGAGIIRYRHVGPLTASNLAGPFGEALRRLGVRF